MGLDGVRAPLAFAVGSVNAATSSSLMWSRCWSRLLRPRDVVVFDNLSSHLGPGGVRGDRASGGEGAAATALSGPDYTPIEEMFSKFKGFLRRVGARAKEHLYDAIGEGLREVTAQDILGWFRHAGLCATQT